MCTAVRRTVPQAYVPPPMAPYGYGMPPPGAPGYGMPPSYDPYAAGGYMPMNPPMGADMGHGPDRGAGDRHDLRHRPY